MKQTDLIAFLQETFQRLKQTSPKFFKVWNTINSIMLFIAGIPTIINWLDIPDLNFLLPDVAVRVVLKVVAFAAGWGLLMNKLTVQSNHEIVKNGLTILSKPCPDLPFTEKKEDIKILDVEEVNKIK